MPRVNSLAAGDVDHDRPMQLAVGALHLRDPLQHVALRLLRNGDSQIPSQQVVPLARDRQQSRRLVIQRIAGRTAKLRWRGDRPQSLLLQRTLQVDVARIGNPNDVEARVS